MCETCPTRITYAVYLISYIIYHISYIRITVSLCRRIAICRFSEAVRWGASSWHAMAQKSCAVFAMWVAKHTTIRTTRMNHESFVHLGSYGFKINFANSVMICVSTRPAFAPRLVIWLICPGRFWSHTDPSVRNVQTVIRSCVFRFWWPTFSYNTHSIVDASVTIGCILGEMSISFVLLGRRHPDHLGQTICAKTTRACWKEAAKQECVQKQRVCKQEAAVVLGFWSSFNGSFATRVHLVNACHGLSLRRCHLDLPWSRMS